MKNENVGKNLLKGICYQAFPKGYDPSTCNETTLFFGSDIASEKLIYLWGEGAKQVKGRNDLKTLKEMGVNLIRLYDWDYANNHLSFLDYCDELNIKVLVPVSNYFLGAFGAPPPFEASINMLIESFSNKSKTDYHNAVYGIIIGSELDLPSQMPNGYLVEYTKQWVKIEQDNYASYRQVPIGHPTSFATHGEKYPCFKWWDSLLPPLLRNDTRDLNKRLFLCPHTYNEAIYLYNNAEGSNKGWVDLAWEKYNLPILFCEIGCSRLTRSDYLDVIGTQISQAIEYSNLPQNQGKLLGLCHFQYCDKVWVPETSEGSFGLTRNTNAVSDTVYFLNAHRETGATEELNISILAKNPSFDIVNKIYKNNG